MPSHPPASLGVPSVPDGWMPAHAPLAVAGVGAALVAVAAIAQPIMVFGGAIALTAGILVVAHAARLRAPYLTAFVVLLAGYACFGRVFSYIGLPPVFIGEVFLAAGLLVTLGCAAWQRLAHSPLVWAIGIFAAWGAVRTVPFVPSLGIDALRDGVVWGYAAFAIVVAGCVRSGDIARALRGYRHLALVLPAVFIGLFAMSMAMGASAPTLPWAPEVSIATFKLGDAGVHLGGAAAFVLLGLGASTRGFAFGSLWWIGWLMAVALVAASSRGGLLAVASAVACAAIAGGPAARRTVARLAVATAVVVAIALTYPTAGDEGIDDDGGRQLSPQQMVANVVSIVGSVGYGQSGGGFVNLDETKTWRLEWWSDIVSYTFAGEYFWQGKGFGINLADHDGYQVTAEVPLRSPHNIHMTVLARSGVPGLVLWVVLNAMFVVALLRGRARALAAGQRQWSRLGVWLLAYWAAIMVNASFDVYLEGPAGGIWFWAVLGFAIAALAIQRSAPVAPEAAR